MPKTLKLHIGQHKTGTSYLQSVLALSVDALAARGIHYGTDKSTQKAAEGAVSFGNWSRFKTLLNAPETLHTIAEPCLLFSSEGFCEYLPEPDFLAKLQTLAAQQAIDRIEVLLFLRDPVDYAVSYFQQLLKRAGHNKIDPVAAFDEEPGPTTARRAIEALDRVPKVSLRVLSYSAERAHVAAHLAEWLGLPLAELTLPIAGKVNRSMTTSELMLIAAINRAMTHVSGTLADALCNRLPEIEADLLRPPLDAQNAYWDRISPDVFWINDRIAPAQAYDRKRDLGAPVPLPGQATFTADQIDVIGQAMATGFEEAARLREQLGDLRQRGVAQRARIAELKEALARRHGPASQD